MSWCFFFFGFFFYRWTVVELPFLVQLATETLTLWSALSLEFKGPFPKKSICRVPRSIKAKLFAVISQPSSLKLPTAVLAFTELLYLPVLLLP